MNKNMYIQSKTELVLLLLLLRRVRAESIKSSKWGGLESSGRRLISSNSKTKRIAFFFSLFFGKKNMLKF